MSGTDYKPWAVEGKDETGFTVRESYKTRKAAERRVRVLTNEGGKVRFFNKDED